MAENIPPEMEQEPKKGWYIPRLFREAREGLCVWDYIRDLLVAIMLTAAAISFHIAEKSETKELYFFALGYFFISIFIVVFVEVFIRAPYKIIKEHDKKIAELEERFKPKFKLYCSKEISACAVPNPSNTMRYFRVVVEVDCATEIENCTGYLTKIEKDGLVIYDHDPRELPFAPSDREDCLAKTLSPKISYLLDVLCTINAVHAVFFATKGQPCAALNKEGEYIFGEEGEYILYVSVKGNAAPTISLKLKFNWTGNESTATIEKID